MTNKILALKYRPQQFKDLIGQDVMAQTITNAIKLKKTPNAYLLTGIRGVGKTTTARLIAKALNCEKNENLKIECTADKLCSTCQQIVNSNHIDILEIDAASKTGIDDIRELIENSKYSPTSAKFKIFIIDEVHMLSKQAFNGLLKTLEEPPTRLKFILATTEVRKIPLTIISRCQRFDLKRVGVKELCKHLKDIAIKEEGKISDEAIKLIARTSEGSVRDSISLLDRVLISSIDGKTIEEQSVREMLGLADKGKLVTLIYEVLSGNEKGALNYLKELIDSGLDAKNFLNDILEILYLFGRRINLGALDKDASISETELQMIEKYSKNINMQDIGLFWQLTIKTLDDLRIVGNENLTLEMYIMQMIHLRNLDERKDIIFNEEKIIENQKINFDEMNDENTLENKFSNKPKNQLKNTDQIKSKLINQKSIEEEKLKIEINSFQDLIHQANKNKEIELKYDLERNVKLVSFKRGNINISFNEKLNKSFIKNLSEKLLDWTGDRWIISLSKNNEAKSIYEKHLESKNNEIQKFENSSKVKEIKRAFPDAKLIDFGEDV